MADGPSDPLSYFAAYGSSDSESDTEPEPEAEAVSPEARAAESNAPPAPRVALPAPEELFGHVSRPSFLSDPRKGRIDWERRLVRAPAEPPREFKVWRSNAVPPPETYAVEERKAPSGADMAVRWSSMYQDNGEDAPQRTSSAAAAEAAELSGSDEENSEEPSGKKRKVETFQQKEKRKRNEGQANREKSFVEEEKRILRQEFCFKE